ncbi:TPR Domain containing protein [Tritrichomonas foetus]|uniref:TPR Domain containing protein n=1 Tax=Tritrichomonas foetus TaxID=1144522 RepID=A0A1J4KAF3_9EUKA|nr:TPR Domain containing protein [Tritrichomonas foetus]|eukprot:OHT06646.1 TPR Domain containing protein [Tritrichomonas foetus]
MEKEIRMNEEKLNQEELIAAFSDLSTRCLSQSATWVLEFLITSGFTQKINLSQKSPQFLQAQAQFRIGEFKKAVNTLKDCQDQESLGLRFLSRLIDLQREIEQTIPDSSNLLGILSSTNNRSNDPYESLAQEAEPFVESFDPINLYIYAAILVRCNRHKDALPFLLKSLNAFPLNRSAWRLLITILIRFDDSVIAPSLGSLPKHWTSLLFRIELFAELQQTEAALRLIPSINLPRTASIVALEAAVRYHHRDFERAQTLFEELRRMDPYRLETLELYSNLLFVKEDVAGLSELAQSLTKIDKFRPETLTVSGNYFAINGRHEEAISHFAMALRFDSSFGFAYTLIGHEFVELENISAAIAAYTKAYEANPRDFRALYGLGRAFEMSKMPYQAILYYRNAVTMNPSDTRMWMALGECYEELMERENAIKCYQRAVCNVDSDGIAIYKLAKLYKEEGDEDRAAFCFENYTEKYVEDEEAAKKDEAKEAILFLAQYFRGKNNLDKAEMYAQRLMFDPSAVAEGNALMKDIRSERK